MTDRCEVWVRNTPRLIGRIRRVYDRLDSTNTLALEFGGESIPQRDGVVIIAREQTGGRGQHGRSWHSPADQSLLMSVILFPPATVRRPVLLTALAAVAVCQTIEELTGLAATIKWPNDVLINGKKVCGILIEQREATVIGIGLNLLQSRRWFEQAGLTEATSLYLKSRKRFSIEQTSRALCRRLDRDYRRLREGRPHGLELRWQGRLRLKGRRVLAQCHQGDTAGRVRRIGFDGVVLELPDRRRAILRPETIRHLTPLR
jgi:BirA family biotin operon repressor/biotin-[acetyl-CoA-carboxylase] ligase